jgi:SAM-dependent MidA family methyltransferase
MSEFDAATENTALRDAIIREIETRDGITFRDYMAMALYHPDLGYYTSRREKIGRTGDYVTSPETSPVFAAIVGRQLREFWETLERPGEFIVAECGAGTGTLARGIVRWASRTAQDLQHAMRYMIVETSGALIERQRETLAGEVVTWEPSLPHRLTGCILSNELLDAMPVHRVTMIHGLLKEVYVTFEGGRFVEDLRPPSTPEIERYFDALGLRPGANCYAEVNLEAAEWARAAAGSVSRGFVLTFDYGYEAAELYAPWRTNGTLMCFYRHNPSHDPYLRIGRQDITSHVDFTTVRRVGEEAGLKTVGLVTQSEFLANLGISDASAPPAETETVLEEYFTRRREVMELVDPAGLGRIKVLCQARGVGNAPLSGFKGDA